MTDNNGFAPTEQMLDPNALAEMLRISLRHLTDVRTDDPTFPKPRMLGTLPRWSPAVIGRWMEEPSIAPADNPAALATQISEVVRPTKPSKKAKAVQRVH
jgi:predicted DNA-binding transcriptional regulator AlpA